MKDVKERACPAEFTNVGGDAAVLTRCPQCGAGVRAGAPYCSLCHADFRPPPVQAPVPSPAPVPTYESTTRVDPLTAPMVDVVPPAAAQEPAAVSAVAPAAQEPAAVPSVRPAAPVSQAEPRWPCAGCGVSNALGVDVCAGCGSPFLAGVREQVSLVVPGVGDLMGLSRGHRLALAAGVALAFAVVVLLLGALFS